MVKLITAIWVLIIPLKNPGGDKVPEMITPPGKWGSHILSNHDHSKILKEKIPKEKILKEKI